MRKTTAVGITTENQYVVAETKKGFMNANKSHNEARNISGSPHTNGSNTGSNRQDVDTANRPEQMGVQNANIRYDMRHILCDNFGNTIN